MASATEIYVAAGRRRSGLRDVYELLADIEAVDMAFPIDQLFQLARGSAGAATNFGD